MAVFNFESLYGPKLIADKEKLKGPRWCVLVVANKIASHGSLLVVKTFIHKVYH
jgi:hypothetical protein